MNKALPDNEKAHSPRRLSQVLRELGQDNHHAVTVSLIIQALGDRSFAALIIVFAAINMLPFPPGSSAILGIPLVIVAAQMMLRRKNAWLPQFILRKSISQARFAYALTKFIPALEWLERIVKPRYWPIPRPYTDVVVGTLCFILAIAVTVPIPLGNWLPAFACALLGLAQSERDGILLGIGIFVGVAALIVIAIVIATGAAAAGFVMQILGLA